MIEIQGPRPTETNLPVMLDMETMGTSPNSVILSIGAIRFNPENGGFYDSFYAVIDKKSCYDLGATHSEETLAWWAKQSPEARTMLSVPGTDVRVVLKAFSDWMDGGSELWGNGSDFDNAMIAEMYRKADVEPPWKFWNNRCYRTMKNMFPRVTFMRQGVYHNALDDAKSQARHLIKILDRMNDRESARAIAEPS